MQHNPGNVDVFQPHLTILDPFTLAAFEDSGWYKVDFNYAESFLWGKGQSVLINIRQ